MTSKLTILYQAYANTNIIWKYNTTYKIPNVSFRVKPCDMFCKWFSATVFAYGLDG